MQYLRRYEDYEMAHWSMHDFRKTARTNLSRLAPWHIAEVALGHILPGESTIYDNHLYLDELTQAYSAYWNHLAVLWAESRSAVAPTRRRYDPRQNLVIPGLALPPPVQPPDRLLTMRWMTATS